MMKRIIFLLFIVALSLSVLGMGCTQSPKTKASSLETTLVQESGVEPELPPVQEPVATLNRVIKMEVTDWDWNPSAITIKKGESVTLEITNTGRMPHGIWIPKLGINEGVRSGKTILVDIEAPSQPAEFTIRCNDPMCGNAEQHANMNATLLITE